MSRSRSIRTRTTLRPRFFEQSRLWPTKLWAGLVAEGRGIEVEAHSTFAEALRGPTAILKDAQAQRGWLAAFTVTGYVGTAFAELAKWVRSLIAEVRTWLTYENSPRKQPGWATRTRKPPQPELFGPSKVRPTTRRDSLRRIPGCSQGSVTTRSSSSSGGTSATSCLTDRH
ncbi:hypothetical protein [Rhodococcus sp. SMB37]|uniref:hypothetical protein n=1 Tax=Rhodococcus sp. SMB37 TaxID=2512213 RepID=UPI001F545DE3|nr:hypothetical protein [Rhodococcus sp. SMB37]